MIAMPMKLRVLKEKQAKSRLFRPKSSVDCFDRPISPLKSSRGFRSVPQHQEKKEEKEIPTCKIT